MTASALLKRFGSTVLSLSSARLWNSFLPRLRLNGTSNSPRRPPSADRICSASAVPVPTRFAMQKRSPCYVLLLYKKGGRRRVAPRPVALPKYEALLASLFEQPLELERLRALSSSHSLTRVDDSSCLGLAFMYNLKVSGIQIQADVLSNLLRIKGTDKLGWNGEQPMRSALFCINRLVREDCAEDSRLLS